MASEIRQHSVSAFVNGRHVATLLFDDESEAKSFFCKRVLAEKSQQHRQNYAVRIIRRDSFGKADEYVTGD
jgi:hypothetical protein